MPVSLQSNHSKLFIMKNRNQLIFRIATGLLTVLMLLGVGMYFTQHDTVSGTFERLGYPAYLVYPLAIAKLLGLVAIWTNKSQTLKEWAYAGFFFDFVLAITAHLAVNDGEFAGAAVALVLLLTSYYFGSRQETA